MIEFIRQLCWVLWGDAPDPAWHPQKPIQKFSGYDAALQQRALERARGNQRTHKGPHDGQLE